MAVFASNYLESLDFSMATRELEDLLFRGTPSLVLDANEWYREHVTADPNETTTRACFEIASSGRKQRQFVTIWRMFDRPKALEAMLAQLQVMVLEQIVTWSRSSFDTVVTCTNSAKTLFEHLHHRIERPNRTVNFLVLPPHPFLTPDRQDVIDLKGRRILLFTDVIASGTLLKSLAETVIRLGGEPVAILAAVVVGPELLSKRLSDNGSLIFPVQDRGEGQVRELPLFSACGYPIAELPPDQFDVDKIIRIDWQSVWPKATGAHGYLKPLFSTQEMIRHFEDANAIDFDLFEHDGCRFFSGVRLEPLFERFGEAIWDRISSSFPQHSDQDPLTPPMLVSTYDVADIQFTRFVEQAARKKGQVIGETVLLHEHERFGDVDSIQPIGETGLTRLAERHVILLLTSVHSAEKLRILAAELAELSVDRLTIVCLLNRMGPKTANFVARVRNLLKGIGAITTVTTARDAMTNPDSLTHFQFVSVYDLSGHESDDVLQVGRSVITLLDDYSSRTRVPSFRRWAEQVRKYFDFMPVTTAGFLAGHTHPLSTAGREIVPLYNGQPAPEKIEVGTIEAKLSLLCRSVASQRRYQLLIDELPRLTTRRDLYRIFAVLLRDVTFLRLTGEASTLRGQLLCEIRRLRSERLARESQQALAGVLDEGLGPLIDASLEREADLWFGVALFSYLDPTHRDYAELACELLHGAYSDHKWLTHPENLMRHFADDRTAWLCSFLLLLSHEDFARAKGDHPTRKRLVADVHRCMALLKTQKERPVSAAVQGAFLAGRKIPPHATVQATEEDRGVAIRRGQDHLSLILTEAGEQPLQTRAQLIRFLWDHLLLVKQGHSPVHSILTKLSAQFAELIADGSPVEGGTGWEALIGDPAVQRDIEDGINVAGLLEQIAEACRQLFRKLPVQQTLLERYLRPARETDSFGGDVIALGDLLQSIRRVNLLTSRQMERYTILKTKLIEELWGDGDEDKDENECVLPRQLRRLNVNLIEVLREAMEHADKDFHERGYDFAKAWRPHLVILRRRGEADHVLYEPTLLRELLRNVCLNATHSFDKLKLRKKGYASRIHVETPKRDDTRLPTLRIVFDGQPLDVRRLEGSTLRRQFQEAEDFGCLATITSDGDKPQRTIVTMQFQRGF